MTGVLKWWAMKDQRQLKDTCLRTKWTSLPYVFLCISRLTKGKPRTVGGSDLANGPPVKNVLNYVSWWVMKGQRHVKNRYQGTKKNNIPLYISMCSDKFKHKSLICLIVIVMPTPSSTISKCYYTTAKKLQYTIAFLHIHYNKEFESNTSFSSILWQNLSHISYLLSNSLHSISILIS